jgi:hypothetical protein
MFSYLRPHHKRTSSNPSSPAEPSQSFESPTQLEHPHLQRQQDASFPEHPTRPPPLLPPIARVSSADSNINTSRYKGFETETRRQWEAERSNGRQGDLQIFGNHQRIQYGDTTRPESAGNSVSTNFGVSHISRQSTAINSEATSRYTSSTSSSLFIAGADSQNRYVPTGRRPNGTRLPSPPPSSSNFAAFEPAPSRSGKTRLNLLNPMSLLARRRASQAVTQLSPESLVSKQSNFSETFDPRIRGTVVHDFSAPRAPRRNVPYLDVQAGKTTGTTSKQHQNPSGEQNTEENLGSPWSSNHTPVFTENFEDEQYPAAGPHVRKADDLTDLTLPKPPYAKVAQKSIMPNTAPKSNETSQKQTQGTNRTSFQKPMPEIPPPVPPKSAVRQSVESRRISINASSPPPKSASKKGRPRNASEVSAKDAAVPKHMKSTSSRFSFDMIGAAEQERLLEDRHRQKALEKQAENADNDEGMEDDYDEYDFDDMDDDGLEERIPGINADLDEEDPYEFTNDDGNLGGFTFQQSSLASPMSPSSPGMVSTPRDADGEVIGFAMTKNSPHSVHGIGQQPVEIPISHSSAGFKSLGGLSALEGLGLRPAEPTQDIIQANESSFSQNEEMDFPRPAPLDDDDLYFDDGIIAGPGNDDYVEFDESVFDNIDTDEYGRPLKRVLAPLSTLYEPPIVSAEPLPCLQKIPEYMSDEENFGEHVPLGEISNTTSLAPRSSVSGSSLTAAATLGLTQDTLAAYQSALAAAAFTAAANGKFRRGSTSPNPTPSEEDNHPGLVTDSSQASHYDTFSPSYEMEDDFDYDDILEDDAIIAAANAEALANDCDGFYGQEFGFYSAPAAGEAEYINGGYFGPRGGDGITRAQSGRVASREPNLTPITEQSEYSNRNSFMSLHMHGLGSAPSPGLAQLAGMMRSPTEYDGDLSLDALLKLRRGAWGGSQVSLHSSNNDSPRSAGPLDEGSPVGQMPPWAQGGAVSSPISNNGIVHRRKNSTFSLGSEGISAIDTGAQSEVSSAPASPNLAHSMSNLTIETPKADENDKHMDDKDHDTMLKKHKYTGSSESISYSKEDDPVVGERWVLERRRTAESGETELLGREIVSGGRI